MRRRKANKKRKSTRHSVECVPPAKPNTPSDFGDLLLWPRFTVRQQECFARAQALTQHPGPHNVSIMLATRCKHWKHLGAFQAILQQLLLLATNCEAQDQNNEVKQGENEHINLSVTIFSQPSVHPTPHTKYNEISECCSRFDQFSTGFGFWNKLLICTKTENFMRRFSVLSGF